MTRQAVARGALSIAIAIGVAALLLWLRGESAPEVATDAREDRPAPIADAPSTEIVPRALAPDAGRAPIAAPEPEPDPEPEPESPVRQVPLAEVLADAPARVTETARGCWHEGSEQGPDDQRVLLHYVLAIEDGWAFAREVRVIDTQIEPELARCIEDRLTALSWEVPGAPDVTRTLQASVSPRSLAPP